MSSFFTEDIIDNTHSRRKQYKYKLISEITSVQ